METVQTKTRRARLTEDQKRDIQLYLTAHRWNGAKRAIAKKHGVRPETISYLVRTLGIK